MHKFLAEFISLLFADPNSKSYRQKSGGVWYKVLTTDDESGWTAGYTFWTNDISRFDDTVETILETENYSHSKK